MTVNDMIKILLDFDKDKNIVIAKDSMRMEILPRDIKEEKDKIIIQI